MVLAVLLLLVVQTPATADTLSPCGWRGTRTLRCFDDTNGDGIRQEGEKYWEGGVNREKGEGNEKSKDIVSP